jgi:sarcosine oxidase, subunit gamma
LSILFSLIPRENGSMASRGDQRAGPLFGRSFSVDGFSMVPAPDAARFVFRGNGVAVDTAGRAFGVDLPRQAYCTSAIGARTASWIGPDEWLVQGPESEQMLIDQQLTEALAGIAHSLVDVSHRDAALAMSGAKTAAALNAGCPLDLHPSVFTVGMCARTLLGKAQIVLWRANPQLFHVLALRSFAKYVWRFLEQAAMDVDN